MAVAWSRVSAAKVVKRLELGYGLQAEEMRPCDDVIMGDEKKGETEDDSWIFGPG